MSLNHHPHQWPMLSLGILVVTLFGSCDKDTDLLSEYVLSEVNQELILTVDDSFTVNSGSSLTLDVLDNDNFSDTEEITITEVSVPTNGEVSLNEDNTIEYVAPESTSSEVTDTFTYTIESVDETGTMISDTGNVSVLVTDETTSKVVENGSYLFTDQALNTLKERFETDYIAGSGFADDISDVKAMAISFAANPSENRSVFGEFEASPREGQDMHSVGLYAVAIKDVDLVNIVASELLATINDNDLYTAFWNNSGTYRWDAEYSFWVQLSKAKKIHDTFRLILQNQTVWSDSDVLAIQTWFERLADLAYSALSTRFKFYLGTDWQNGLGKFLHAGEYPGNHNPVQDANGNDLYIIGYAQDHFNNRNWDIISYIHDWAVYNSDLEKEKWVRDFFKITIKYGLFPDGTFWEMQRNKDEYPTLGVWYGWITSGAMVQIAHLDAMADHFPNDRLYDYETTEGILNGSIDLQPEGYVGTSTTDGETKKSLLTLLKGQTKYYRSSANGGWNDERFYTMDSDNTLVALDPTGFTQPSAIVAVANLYYKDQDLKDYYTFNASVGYPAKQNTSQGYLAGVGNDDWGPWGTYIFGSAWYGQENNFFN